MVGLDYMILSTFYFFSEKSQMYNRKQLPFEAWAGTGFQVSTLPSTHTSTKDPEGSLYIPRVYSTCHLPSAGIPENIRQMQVLVEETGCNLS